MIKLMSRTKTILVLMLALALCGCGTKANDNAAKTEEAEINIEYPKIVVIGEASYYGTDEKCEMVPRKAVDGTIESFVDAAIMPDVDGYANFGADQGKLEYMFVEDGRLIVHIGDDWYYFEKKVENTAVYNPWIDTDEQGVLEATGHSIKAPEGASDVNYSYCVDDKMAQVTYMEDSINWTYRIKGTSALEDISGMYYEWNVSEDGMVSGKNAVYMSYSDAKEDSEYIDDVYYVQVVNWYDDETGDTYSLSASGNNLNGMDIQVYAEQLFTK